MIVKKLNAVCAWILTVLLLIHVSTTVAFLLTGWYVLTVLIIVSRATAAVCFAHVCLSLWSLFFLHDGADMRGYARLNRRTVIQRATGIAILVLVHPHTKLFESFLYEGIPLTVAGKLLVFVLEALFFGVCFLHLSQSFSRSLITMGLLREETAEKRTDLIAWVVCAAGFGVAVIALALFLVHWPVA